MKKGRPPQTAIVAVPIRKPRRLGNGSSKNLSNTGFQALLEVPDTKVYLSKSLKARSLNGLASIDYYTKKAPPRRGLDT